MCDDIVVYGPADNVVDRWTVVFPRTLLSDGTAMAVTCADDPNVFYQHCTVHGDGADNPCPWLGEPIPFSVLPDKVRTTIASDIEEAE